MIYKNKTKHIAILSNVVVKTFFDKKEGREEVANIKSNLTLNEKDCKTGYINKTVEYKYINDSVLVMEKATGFQMDRLNSLDVKDYYYIGRWLRQFHLKHVRSDGKVRLYGDVNPTHFFIDKQKKILTAIDPGLAFGSIGNKYIDISRFIVETLKSARTILSENNSLNTIITEFINGYFDGEDMDRNKLRRLVFERIDFNYKKQKHHSSKVKAKLKHYIIKYKVSKLIILNQKSDYR